MCMTGYKGYLTIFTQDTKAQWNKKKSKPWFELFYKTYYSK